MAQLDIDFPFGAQPDISNYCCSLFYTGVEKRLTFDYLVRANQKDVYYQLVLQEQMTRVAQQFLGK